MAAGWHVGNAADEGAGNRGWILGYFMKTIGGVRFSADVEVKWGVHVAGEKRAEWTVGDKRTTLALLIEGHFRVDLSNASAVLARQGGLRPVGTGDRPFLGSPC